ncbi:prenyltransferase [Streptococcus pseudoporcinus]|uniref:UbiA prenyltransferase family protein n=1 Tax=Streptococcus pseudoporcinus TaxID=361101 RepID=A0A4U9XIR2_9STRE|nr:prenyltransferase [Streptococcus pseudoporcinus]VTS12318.1 UbiA prenyltransferase family protein [Streptococcus pseudoporcinus]VUC64844.1 UbiA prenyltransferase family protein [Streptococcus pseudoporcinus]VUC95318.1 UbiA prenyltransferase family protein [Streptococcus pseudoporcinus]VUC95629.1 UbiA prenyltransferase family protein [Streptococcus pseudoporcinus]
MTIPVFLELVEMKAKTASVLPFLIGLCFSYYHYGSVHLFLVLLFFLAMFCFNMFVDIWDNYNDYKNAINLDYQVQTNIIGRESLSLKSIEQMMAIFLFISAAIGILLTVMVGWPLLVMGLFCFGVGIFYSYGPRPLSSLPFGEFFSGFTMGFMISLICVYLNTYDKFSWDFSTLGAIFLISLPNTLWIANLMLANNLCDKEEDESNHRYTLVHYTGLKGGLVLFALGNIMAMLAIIGQYMLGLAPVAVLLCLFLVPFIYKQTSLLWQKQVKKETFICAVRILALGSLTHVVTYFVGLLLK